MAPGGPLPLAPLGHPAGLPLRRCACSGQSGMRGTFRPLRSPFRPRALAPLFAPPPPSARARSGLRRAFAGGDPAGSLAPPIGPGRARRPGAVRPPVALAAGRPAGRPGSGPLAWALGSPGRPAGRCGLPVVALGPLRAPWLPGGCSLRRGPPAAPGCARLRFACPPGSRRGPMAALAGRFFRPPGPRRLGVWGVPPLRRRARGPSAPRSRRFRRVVVHPGGVFLALRGPFRAVAKGILMVPGG